MDRPRATGYWWGVPPCEGRAADVVFSRLRGEVLRRFPPEAGFVVEERALSGAVAGRVLVVRRGRFEGRVSLQRMALGGARGSGDRLVAVARVRPPSGGGRAGRGRLRRWAAPLSLLVGGVVVAGVTALLGTLAASTGAVGKALVQWAFAAWVGTMLGVAVARDLWGVLSAAGRNPALSAEERMGGDSSDRSWADVTSFEEVLPRLGATVRQPVVLAGFRGGGPEALPEGPLPLGEPQRESSGAAGCASREPLLSLSNPAFPPVQ